MKNVAEIHTIHRTLESEILFFKKEIEFLLKILKNAYSVSVNKEKIKLLDGYWKGFEQSNLQLDSLLSKILNDEIRFATLLGDNLIDAETTYFKEDHLEEEFKKISEGIRSYKESFYEYMNGCEGCCIKKII